MSLQEPIQEPTLYEQNETLLRPEHNLFQCDRAGCGHLVGDTRSANFLARCPGCESIVRFYRIIE